MECLKEGKGKGKYYNYIKLENKNNLENVIDMIHQIHFKMQ